MEVGLDDRGGNGRSDLDRYRVARLLAEDLKKRRITRREEVHLHFHVHSRRHFGHWGPGTGMLLEVEDRRHPHHHGFAGTKRAQTATNGRCAEQYEVADDVVLAAWLG